MPVKKLLHPSHYQWDGIGSAFIVSTGRTGTQFLAKFFNDAFDRVFGFHEPVDHSSDLAASYFRGEITAQEAERRFRRERDSMCAEVHRTGSDFYVESNQYLAFGIPIIQRVFPDAMIVHVVRDGRDVVRSGMDFKVIGRDKSGKTALFMSDDDPIRRVQASDFPDSPHHDCWDRMSRFERLSWFWAMKDRQICAALAGNERAITVKFEDIFDKQREYPGMWEIIRFLGLEDRMRVPLSSFGAMMSRRANETKQQLFPKWPEWTPERRHQFTTIAGAHNETYGYHW